MELLQRERENFNRLRRAHDRDPVGPAVHVALPDLADAWHLRLAEETCRAADALGLNIRLAVTRGDRVREAEAAVVCEISDGLGLIMVTDAPLPKHVGRRCRVVAIGPTGDADAVPTVSTGRGHAIEMAIAHLAGLGHTAIGFGYTGLPYAHEHTLRLVRQAAGRRGIDDGLQSMDVGGGRCVAPMVEAAQRRDVTAFLVSDDTVARALVHALRQADIQVPINVSVAGYGQCEAATDCGRLTTVNHPIAEVAHTAVDAIVRGRAPSVVEFAPRLRIGATSGYASRSVASR